MKRHVLAVGDERIVDEQVFAIAERHDVVGLANSCKQQRRSGLQFRRLVVGAVVF